MQQNHRHNNHPNQRQTQSQQKRAADVGVEGEGKGVFNAIGESSSVVATGGRRRVSGNGGRGHQKKHLEWLDKFGEVSIKRSRAELVIQANVRLALSVHTCFEQVLCFWSMLGRRTRLLLKHLIDYTSGALHVMCGLQVLVSTPNARPGSALFSPSTHTHTHTHTQDKRLARQEQEAKAQRHEAARRRTRDLLLERAKQRLLVAASAASSTATANKGATLAGGVDGEKGKEGASAHGGTGVKGEAGMSEGGVMGLPLYAQETWAARRNKVWSGEGRKGRVGGGAE